MNNPFDCALTGVEPSMPEIASRIAISQVLMRYARGIDRGDRDLIKSVYHEGGTDDHGSFVGSGTDFADFIVDAMNAVGGTGQHHISNVLIEFQDENSAFVESYYLAMHPYPNANGQIELAFVGGRYLDRFSRRNGRWAIDARKVTFDWTRESVPGPEWTRAADFTGGTRDETDASWQWFS
ncbi:MAG: hypothetical protein RJB08_310 [Actinomycetota bacterium]|jgi:hypothetical protein